MLHTDSSKINTDAKSSFKGIFWLLALVLAVPLAGLCINADAFEPRMFWLPIMWIVLLLLPYILLQKRFLYVIVASLVFVDGFINLFHWCILKCPLNASSIFVFMNTNYSEATEFMTVKMTPLLLLLVPYVLLFVLTLKHIPYLAFRKKSEIIVWSALWLFVALFFAENMISGRFLRLCVPDVERALVSFYAESKAYKNLKKRDLYDVNVQMTTSDSTLVLVVIGESCNRNHMSIYGYHRPTTPRLASRNDIWVFDNVISANSNTLSSVMLFLSENNMDFQRPMDSCIHIFDVLHSARYKSYWLSNQSPIGLWDNGVTNLASNADVVLFVNMTASSSMESTQMASFDQKLFEPLGTSLSENEKHKVVFLHLMGCHTQYDKRYPRDFERFKVAKNKRGKVMNAYDNAVYYSDFVVDSLFTVVATYSRQHPKVRISALYFSDHGENVYDEGDYCGHDYSGKIPHANVEIPFFLWFSESQQASLQSENVCLEQRLHAPYMIDDLFHTLMDLAAVRASCFDDRRSLVNKDFDASRKRILEDGRCY
jgi:heptose-I-phosphate ethanolaminephosphotransferase